VQVYANLKTLYATPVHSKEIARPMLKTPFPYCQLRLKIITVRKRYFNYIIVETPTHYWIEKRTDSDIWRDLHQVLLIETDKKISPQQLKKQLIEKEYFKNKPNFSFST